MSTEPYGLQPFGAQTSHSNRRVRWDLLLVLAIDLAIWGALIAAGAGLYKLFT